MTDTVSLPNRHPRAVLAAIVAGCLLGVAAISGWVVESSRATLSGATSNSANVWSAGSLTLSDNDAGSAMFNATNLSPGDSVQRCIQVTYTSTTSPAAVKLYGSITGTGLADYLDTTIEEGTGGGAFADCTGFTASATIFTGELDEFSATHTGFATGAGSWTPTSSPQTITYRITTAVQNTQAAQALTAAGSFTWEAQA